MFTAATKISEENQSSEFSYELDISGILTEIPQCLNVNIGKIEIDILNGLDYDEFDQAPVLTEDSQGVLGIIETKDLHYLFKRKMKLSFKSSFIKKDFTSSKTSFNEILRIFENTKSVLVTQGTKEEDGIVLGLLTLADLNKSSFRAILYQLFAELEVSLSKIVDQKFEDHWEWINLLNQDQQMLLIGGWEIAKRNKVNLRPINGANLTQILKIIGNSEELRKAMNFNTKNKYEDSANKIPDIRNKIMHPVRPLVLNSTDVSRLRKCLISITELQKLADQILAAGV